MASFYPGTAGSLLTSSCKDMVMARFLGIFSRQQRWHTIFDPALIHLSLEVYLFIYFAISNSIPRC